jgi:hypothetical protein
MKFSLEILSGKENFKKLGIGGRIMMKSVLKGQGMWCVLNANWYVIDPSALNTVMNHWIRSLVTSALGLLIGRG